ncbi:hypothetical protein Nepgr_003518 [Nepenthes gracilis]|uniref:Thioredoxin domain-containing protein n=1 Tax=Nepenthes gracilis TaxID=150966 RepID=A0AAD3XDQ0_NEPGR|nr:hypothetical protein Nepgr_003518 [Nepenthes gracilis]
MGNNCLPMFSGGEKRRAKASAVVEVHTTDEWRTHFEASKRSAKLMVIDFSAGWCGPCHYMEPIVDEFSKKFSDVEFIKIDVDELRDVSNEFTIEAMPTFLFVKNGQEVDRLVGAKKDELKQKLKTHRVF